MVVTFLFNTSCLERLRGFSRTFDFFRFWIFSDFVDFFLILGFWLRRLRFFGAWKTNPCDIRSFLQEGGARAETCGLFPWPSQLVQSAAPLAPGTQPGTVGRADPGPNWPGPQAAQSPAGQVQKPAGWQLARATGRPDPGWPGPQACRNPTGRTGWLARFQLARPTGGPDPEKT